MNLVAVGLTQLARGLRRAQPGLAALGAAMVVVGWSRRRNTAEEKILYSGGLQPGQALEFRMKER